MLAEIFKLLGLGSSISYIFTYSYLSLETLKTLLSLVHCSKKIQNALPHVNSFYTMVKTLHEQRLTFRCSRLMDCGDRMQQRAKMAFKLILRLAVSFFVEIQEIHHGSISCVHFFICGKVRRRKSNGSIQLLFFFFFSRLYEYYDILI